METDSLIKTINEIHLELNGALEQQNLDAYLSCFSDDFKYTNIDKLTSDKAQFSAQLKAAFRPVKEYHTSHYRVKSSSEDGLFKEKIARKSVIRSAAYLILSKKQTIQTEELYTWKMTEGKWKVKEMELVLEEKY